MYSSNPNNFETLLQQGYQVNIGKYLSRGWEIFKQNWVNFFFFFFIVLSINLRLKAFPQITEVASLVIGALMNAGFTFVAVKIAKNKKVSFDDFFRGFKYFIPVIFSTILMSVFVFIGMILLLIPGIYLGIAYMFTIPLIVEKKMPFWAAMEASRKIITKNWFSMFSFILVLGLINIVGILSLIVGLLFTAPLSGCAMIAAYEDIVGFNLSSDSTED